MHNAPGRAESQELFCLPCQKLQITVFIEVSKKSRPFYSILTVAEEFEIYINGLELANAFSELTDVQEQRQRFESDMDLKERLYGFRYPIDDDFLKALEFGFIVVLWMALK